MQQPGSTSEALKATVSALTTVSESLSAYEARLKSLETRLELHQHGPAFAELEIKMQAVADRLDRHANFLRSRPAKDDSLEAQLRKLFHEVSLLKRAAKLEESLDLFSQL